MLIALFQPDIPQNLGAALRLGACLGVAVDIIEPCGFPLSDRAIARSAMDYGVLAQVTRHSGWAAFRQKRSGRLVLLTTKSATAFHEFAFDENDVLLFGRESAGVPDEVHEAADIRLTIPMAPGARSLNVVNAAAMVLGEALRQTKGFPIPDGTS
jgi:tRNA (cytidine/uridine-2'-O-)-methyltransferase